MDTAIPYLNEYLALQAWEPVCSETLAIYRLITIHCVVWARDTNSIVLVYEFGLVFDG